MRKAELLARVDGDVAAVSIDAYREVRMMWYIEPTPVALEHGNLYEIHHAQGQLILQVKIDGEWHDVK